MKHIKWIVSITVLSMIFALSQYFVTDIPGRAIFWPLAILLNIGYVCTVLRRGKTQTESQTKQ